MDRMKVLITGGAGFIGSELALKLLILNHEVIVLDNLCKQIHGEKPQESYTYKRIKDKVGFVYGDVKNEEDWLKVIDDVDYIVHLAAETGTGQSMYEIKKYTDVNIGGTCVMLDVLTNRKNNIKKVVFASSRAVYGEGKYFCEKDGMVYPGPRSLQDLLDGDFSVKCPICGGGVEPEYTDEDGKLSPSSVYGFTKQAQEQLSSIVCSSIHVPYVGLRFQNVYGPGQSLQNPYTGILSIFSNLLMQNKSINIFEDGRETRDFVYIDDVVDSIILALTENTADNHIINVGSQEKIDVITIADTLKRIYESESKVEVTGNFRIGDIRHNVADLERAKKLLGYTPKVNFELGIHNFAQWVKAQKIQPINYVESLDEMKVRGLLK